MTNGMQWIIGMCILCALPFVLAAGLSLIDRGAKKRLKK